MKATRIRKIIAVGVAAAVLGPLLFSGGAIAASKEPVKIGVIDPLTGPAARIGKENLEGMEFADDFG